MQQYIPEMEEEQIMIDPTPPEIRQMNAPHPAVQRMRKL